MGLVFRWLEHLVLHRLPQPPPTPCSPAVLAGGALGGALDWGALGGPLPLGAFAQPLEHGRKGRCWLRLGSAGGRRRAAGGSVCPHWWLGWALARWGRWAPGGKAASGRPLPAGEAGLLRMHPLSPTLTPAPAQPVWEERAQPRGRGAPDCRTPREGLDLSHPQAQGELAVITPRGGNSRAQEDGAPDRRTDTRRHAQAQGQRSSLRVWAWVNKQPAQL